MTDSEPTLADLGMDHLSSRALAALPLAEVAWADGSVHARERENVVRAADASLGLGEEGAMLLLDWLRYRPTDAYFAAGRVLLRRLAMTPGSGFDEALLRKVVELARAVAKSAGGFFRFFRIKRSERKVLDQVTADLSSMLRPEEAGAPRTRTFQATMIAADEDATDPDAPNLLGVLITGEGEQRRKHVLDQAGLVIGSGEGARVILAGAGVAAKHARIFEAKRRFYIEDLSSPSGTFVNGERVGKRRLLGGETLRLGAHDVVFKMARRN